jgi:replicative DNA helicase
MSRNNGDSDTIPNLKRSRRQPAPSAIDRLPPNSCEAEQGVLGCALLSPAECIPEIVGKLRDGASEMYDLRHQTILSTILDLFDVQVAVDVITLQERLKLFGQLDEIGGIAYLSSLADTVPSAANIAYYLDIVHEKYLLRRTIQTCTNAVASVYDFNGESVEELLDNVEREILAIGEQRVFMQGREAKELADTTMQMIEERILNPGRMMGFRTGFPDLDRKTNGFKPAEMIVIAGRPGMGKTALAMNIVDYAAVELGLPVGVFNLEMSAESLMLRMICARSRVPLSSVMSGFIADGDIAKLTNAAAALSASPLYIEDSSSLSILQLRAKSRRLQQRYGIKFMVVDYLQLLHSTNRRSENRQQEIADISRGIKCLTKELGIPILVLSQLNRDVERDKGRRPRLSDLRESGAIEQDADIVGLLFAPKDPDEDPDSDESSSDNAKPYLPITMILEKQRNGPTGDVQFTFFRIFTRFESVAKASDGDVPAASQDSNPNPSPESAAYTPSLPYTD